MFLLGASRKILWRVLDIFLGFSRVPGCPRGGDVPGEPWGFRLGRLGFTLGLEAARAWSWVPIKEGFFFLQDTARENSVLPDCQSRRFQSGCVGFVKGAWSSSRPSKGAWGGPSSASGREAQGGATGLALCEAPSGHAWIWELSCQQSLPDSQVSRRSFKRRLWWHISFIPPTTASSRPFEVTMKSPPGPGWSALKAEGWRRQDKTTSEEVASGVRSNASMLSNQGWHRSNQVVWKYVVKTALTIYAKSREDSEGARGHEERQCVRRTWPFQKTSLDTRRFMEICLFRCEKS